MEPPVSSFRRCSSCKKEIGFGADYWVCNVSTCNQKRTGLAFCTVSCWEAHLPVMRHRESWAVEKKAPRREEWEREQREAAAKVTGATGTPKTPPPGAPPVRRAAAQPATPAAAPPRPTPLQPVAQREVLVVASKLKQYVRDRSGMNTSDAVMDVLSEALRTLADRAIRNAERDGRKTVLDRDFPKSV